MPKSKICSQVQTYFVHVEEKGEGISQSQTLQNVPVVSGLLLRAAVIGRQLAVLQLLSFTGSKSQQKNTILDHHDIYERA